MKNNYVNIIAEIGINHNGSLAEAVRLIQIAKSAGCDYVKLQKRTPEICVPEEQKTKMRKVPWREEEITYFQYKKDIEFETEEYRYLYGVANELGIKLFSSVWDIPSAKFMQLYTDIVKIPSALLTDWDLLKFCSTRFKTRILSTGMSTEEDIDRAISLFNPTVLFHTNSAYPSPIEDLNLGYISWLKNKHPNIEVGYSNHYYGLVPMFAAVALGSQWLEFHITTDHTNWGSDQKSSVEPSGVFKLVKGVRDLKLALEKGNAPREILPSELEKMKSLRV